MLEKDVERKLKKAVEALGCLCLKFESPGYTGVPDRVILVPGGLIAFAETKAPGRKERPRQVWVQQELRKMGFHVFSTVDSIDKVTEVVRWCKAEIEKDKIRKSIRDFIGES